MFGISRQNDMCYRKRRKSMKDNHFNSDDIDIYRGLTADQLAESELQLSDSE